MTTQKSLEYEAIQWIVRLKSRRDTEAPDAFRLWLNESPAHVQAYKRMCELDHRLTELAQIIAQDPKFGIEGKEG